MEFEDIKPTAPAHHDLWVEASNETFVNYDQRNLNRLVKNNKANGKKFQKNYKKKILFVVIEDATS